MFINATSKLNDLSEPYDDKKVITLLKESISSPESIIMVFTLLLITLFTIIGNTMVIISIFTYKPLKNVQNMFLVNLAITDISVAIIVLPFSIIDMLLNDWIFGTFLCQLWLTSDVLLCTASILNLCTIALDRYWAIYDPINYAQRRTIKQVILKIISVWLISALISIPPLFGLNDWPEEFAGDTPCKYSEHLGYVIYSASGSFYIPLLIMSVVYLKIYRATSKRLRGRVKASSVPIGRELITATTTTTTTTTTTASVNQLIRDDSPYKLNNQAIIGDAEKVLHKKARKAIVINGDNDQYCNQIMANKEDTNAYLSENGCDDREDSVEHDEDKNKINQLFAIEEGSTSSVQKFWQEKQKISLSKERRQARILGVVMGVFTICWLPFFIMYLIIPFYPNVSMHVRAFITWLGYINSALNPIIYTIFNVDFRRAFHHQLSSCKFKC